MSDSARSPVILFHLNSREPSAAATSSHSGRFRRAFHGSLSSSDLFFAEGAEEIREGTVPIHRGCSDARGCGERACDGRARDGSAESKSGPPDRASATRAALRAVRIRDLPTPFGGWCGWGLMWFVGMGLETPDRASSAVIPLHTQKLSTPCGYKRLYPLTNCPNM